MTDRRQRILIVEGDPALRALEERILSSSGFDVHAATGDDECRSLADAGGWDLFLLDIPDDAGDTLDLARWLRASERCGSTPILFSSARRDPDIVREAFDTGASLMLVKPFSATTLLSLVRAAMTTA